MSSGKGTPTLESDFTPLALWRSLPERQWDSNPPDLGAAQHTLRAHLPPCRPGLPLTGFRLMCAHHRQGFPCCYLIPLACMPASSTPARASRCLYRSFPGRRRPFPFPRRVDTRIALFDACSTFAALRPACSLSRLTRPFLPKCFNPFLHEPLWLLPAGAIGAGRDLHPPKSGAFPRRTRKSD